MRIIINADDFGMTRSINQAVVELAQIGSLTSTTAMVNMPYWKQVEMLLPFDDFGIGLHFNLTEGKPVCDSSLVPSLVDADGNFHAFSEFRSRCKKNKINKDEILTELKAQFELLYNFIGARLTHIDSHQGVHKYRPVSDVLIDFGDLHNNLGLRSPRHYFITNKNVVVRPTASRFSQFSFKRIFVEYYYNTYQKSLSKKFRMPAGELLDISLQKTKTFERLIDIRPTSNITIEIPCHPATSTNDLPPSKLTDKRVREYQILMSSDFIGVLNKYQLINFSNL